MTGDVRSRFMTAAQLRHHIGFSPFEDLPDYKVRSGELAINWERIPGGASIDELVDWNLRGEQWWPETHF